MSAIVPLHCGVLLLAPLLLSILSGSREVSGDGEAAGANQTDQSDQAATGDGARKPTEEEMIAKMINPGAGKPGGGDQNPTGDQKPPAEPPAADKAEDNKGGKDEGGKGQSDQQQQQGQKDQTDQKESSDAAADGVPSYIKCLEHIAAQLCDPEHIFSAKQKSEIDQTLTELKSATRKESAKDECAKSGLEAMFIIVRHSALLDDPMSAVQQKLNDALNVWVREHPCEKPLVIMLSTDPSMYGRKIWTGMHYEVNVDPGHLVQLFMDQNSLTAQEKYSEVILNMIEGLLDRYEHAIGK